MGDLLEIFSWFLIFNLETRNLSLGYWDGTLASFYSPIAGDHKFSEIIFGFA